MSGGIEAMYDEAKEKAKHYDIYSHYYNYKDLPVENNPEVDNPSHYAESYEFEVYEVIKWILDTYYQQASPYDIWQVGQELKYRFRAGLKEDGHNGAQDIAKAMRCRQMRDCSK